MKIVILLCCQIDLKMDHMGKEVDLVKQADKPSSVNLIYSLRFEATM